ncbi:MAG: zinc dependent phospholipase C family protein [Bacillota bacterium]
MSICTKHLWPAFKILLIAGSPIQKIIDKGGETHLFINNQSLDILKNDGKITTFNTIERYRQYIDLGNLWADKGWKCFAHYYNPQNGKGIIPLISAFTECNNYFEAALFNWKIEKYQKAMFYLGAAAHIVQDMCVPHHAMGIAFNGHRKFETWAMINKDQFKTKNSSLYDDFKSIYELVNANSELARKYYYDVAEYSIIGYMKTAKELLSLSQKTTAYLFDYFVRISH